MSEIINGIKSDTISERDYRYIAETCKRNACCLYEGVFL